MSSVKQLRNQTKEAFHDFIILLAFLVVVALVVCLWMLWLYGTGTPMQDVPRESSLKDVGTVYVGISLVAALVSFPVLFWLNGDEERVVRSKILRWPVGVAAIIACTSPWVVAWLIPYARDKKRKRM